MLNPRRFSGTSLILSGMAASGFWTGLRECRCVRSHTSRYEFPGLDENWSNPEPQLKLDLLQDSPDCPIPRSLNIIIQTIIQNHDDFRAPPESDETTGLRPNFHSGRDGALLPRAVVSPRRFLDRRLPLSVSADLATTTSRNRPSSWRLPPRWRRLVPPGRTASLGR